MKAPTPDWTAWAGRLDGAGEDVDYVVDELISLALSEPPDAAAARPLVQALGTARSESSKRDAAIALARVAPLDDTDAVEALEDAYRKAKPDPSLGQALLGTMGLLGLRCPMARAAAAAAVQKLRLTDNSYLLMAGAKVIGLLCGQRDDADLRQKLGQLAESTDSGVASETRYQLAALKMADAFQAETNDELTASLEEARSDFATAERLEEMRPDAELFRLLIDLVLGFNAILPSVQVAAGQTKTLVSTIRRKVGGLGERVFQGYGSDAWNHLERRVLDMAEALERAAAEIAEANEWTRLHETVVLLAESYSTLMARPARFLGQERLEAALGGVAERVFRPRLGTVLSLHLSRAQFARIVRDHEIESGRDGVYRGLKALDETAQDAERNGDFKLSPQNRGEMAELAERTGRSPDELVSDMILVFRRGDTDQWASQLGAKGQTNQRPPVPPWREPLWEALRAAFTPASFGRMLWMKLNVRLDDIAAPGNFQEVTADVVRWAETTGRVGDLLRAALAANPDSPQLKRVLEQYGGML